MNSDATSQPTVGNDLLHPPFEVLLFLPLTFLTFKTACVTWFFCNITFLWLFPIVLWKQIPRLHSELHLISVAIGIVRPVILCLVYGQDSILLLLLLTLSLASLTRRHNFRAGIFLALGLFKFHLVLPLVAVLLVARKWRALAGFFTGLVALLTASFTVIGTRVTLNYVEFILQYGRHISVSAQQKTALMPNLRGLVAFLSRRADARLQSAVVVSLSFAFFVLLMCWTVKFRHLPIATQFSFAVAITSLISYHYYPHNSVILLLPCLLIANHFLDPNTNSGLRWIFCASAVAFCLTTFGFVPVDKAMPLLALETLALAAIVFTIPYTERVAVSARPSAEQLGAQ